MNHNGIHNPNPITPITKWLKRSKFHDAMFFWVRALKINLPAISVEDAVRNFIKHNGHINDTVVDDKKIHSFASEYDRWVRELYAHQKSA